MDSRIRTASARAPAKEGVTNKPFSINSCSARAMGVPARPPRQRCCAPTRSSSGSHSSRKTEAAKFTLQRFATATRALYDASVGRRTGATGVPVGKGRWAAAADPGEPFDAPRRVVGAAVTTINAEAAATASAAAAAAVGVDLRLDPRGEGGGGWLAFLALVPRRADEE